MLSVEEKAAKWDALEKEIAKYYLSDDVEVNEDEGGDLSDIGEIAAMAFGFL